MILSPMILRQLPQRKYTNAVVFHNSLSGDACAEEVDNWHRTHPTHPWLCIGYHKIIRKNGDVEDGRPVHLVGAHAYGMNWQTIGVCLMGNFFHEEPTVAQIESATGLWHGLCRHYGKRLGIWFHRPGWMPNACPGPRLDRADFREILMREDPYRV